MTSREDQVTTLAGALLLTFCSGCWGFKGAAPLFSILQHGLQDYLKPLTYMLILAIGKFLRMKRQTVVHVLGFQTVILSCLLPALLFKAVVSMPMEGAQDAWQLALVAIVFMAFLAAGCKLLMLVTGFPKLRTEVNTISLMFNGLAPGLTSLPFIEAVVEFIPPGIIGVGHVALADLGVKCNVLFVSYFTAVFRVKQGARRTAALLPVKAVGKGGDGSGGAIQALKAAAGLARGYFAEPVNVSSVIGVILLAVGPVRLDDQWLAGRGVRYLAACCTPSIFLLIGVKLQRLQRKQFGLLALMVARTGLALLFVSLLQHALGLDVQETMFWIFFCNSSVSFWPYTHIVQFANEEKKKAVRMLSAYLSEISSEMSADLQQQDAWCPAAESIQELDRIISNLAADNSDFQAAVDEAKEVVAIAARQSRSEMLLGAVKALNSDLSPTFDVALALMIISVSFSWTVTFCTVISFIPPSMWMPLPVLPTAGVLFFLLGAGYLRLHARQIEKEGEEASRQEVEVDDEFGFGGAARRGRCSIYDDHMEPDELAVAEADQQVRRVGAAMHGEVQAHEEANFAFCTNMREMAPVDPHDPAVEQSRRSRRSLMMFLRHSTTDRSHVCRTSVHSTPKCSVADQPCGASDEFADTEAEMLPAVLTSIKTVGPGLGKLKANDGTKDGGDLGKDSDNNEVTI